MEPKMTIKDAAKALDLTVQAVHKKIKKLEIRPQISQKKAYLTHSEARKLFISENVKSLTDGCTIIAVQVVKGGTGKTAVVSNLASRLNVYGARVLCIDLDQQANLTSAFGIESDRDTPVMVDVIDSVNDKKKSKIHLSDAILEVCDGLHLVPSRIDNAVLDTIILSQRLTNLKKLYSSQITPLKKHYDFIIIDCPPSLSNSVGAASLCADYVIAPICPEGAALEGLELTLNEFKRLEHDYDKEINVKIVNNKFDVRTRLSHTIYTQLLENKDYKNKLFRVHIRNSQEFPNCYYQGVSVFDSLKETPAKEDIDFLAQEVLGIGTFEDTSIKAPTRTRKRTKKSKVEVAA